MKFAVVLICSIIALSTCGPAHAEKRVALVIGNGAYQGTTELKNPRNDAADVAAALLRLEFKVIEGVDLDKRSMERLIRQFGDELPGVDVALFFYAGHGLQISGQNYLVPTDARLSSERDVDFESMPLVLILKQMERDAKTSLVLLDACRDNPLARNLARTMGTRSSQVSQGLAEMRTGVGTLIGFSTQPGNVALDGAGRNSPYTEALLKYIGEPGKDVSATLIAVRREVVKITNGRQVPWEHTSLMGQVLFKPEVPLPKAPDFDKEMEVVLWTTVKDSKSPAVLRTYLERFPNGTFAGLSRVMIEQLEKLEKLEKEARVAPAQTPEEPKRPAEQSKVASLPATPDPPQRVEPAKPDPTVLTRALQTELKRIGCYAGPTDGKWSAKTKHALSQFGSTSKVAVAVDEPTHAALQAVTDQKGRICGPNCSAGEDEVNGKCVAKAESKPKAVDAGAKRTVAKPGAEPAGKQHKQQMCRNSQMWEVPCDSGYATK